MKEECGLSYALDVIGGKWKLAIIWTLYKNEIVRYNELRRQVNGITNMMLTQSLKELEKQDIVIRKQYLEIPPRVEYSLSESGKKLLPILKELEKWGKEVNNK